jgi:hypothetical protein
MHPSDGRWCLALCASAAGTALSVLPTQGITSPVDSAAQIILAPCLWPHTISARSRPALGDRELVETAPKDPSAPGTSCTLCFSGSRAQSLISFVSRQPSQAPLLHRCLHVYRKGAPSGWNLASSPISLPSSFTHSCFHRASPAHCLAVVHWYTTLFNHLAHTPLRPVTPGSPARPPHSFPLRLPAIIVQAFTQLPLTRCISISVSPPVVLALPCLYLTCLWNPC